MTLLDWWNLQTPEGKIGISFMFCVFAWGVAVAAFSAGRAIHRRLFDVGIARAQEKHYRAGMLVLRDRFANGSMTEYEALQWHHKIGDWLEIGETIRRMR